MKIIHESPEELVIRSPTTGARVLGTCFLVVGALLILAGVLVRPSVPADGGPEVGPAWIFVPFGLFLALPGVVAWVRAQPTDYHFAGREGQLIVRRRRGDRVIPFARIEAAQMYEEAGSGDEPSTYGLRLVLRDPHQKWEMSQLLTSGARSRESKAELADRINCFLVAHGKKP
jgi:hypothetical protein